jgi:hypothetical protein
VLLLPCVAVEVVVCLGGYCFVWLRCDLVKAEYCMVLLLKVEVRLLASDLLRYCFGVEEDGYRGASEEESCRGGR